MFSATHLGAFFTLALGHLAQDPVAPFNYLRAFRHEMGDLERPAAHIEKFFALYAQNTLPQTSAEDFVASAILMNSDPLNMHCDELHPSFPRNC